MRALAILVLLVGTAYAQAPAQRIVALAPLSTLGSEDTSVATKKLNQQIEAALASLPNTRVITSAQVSQAIAKAKKPLLRQCERDPACISEVGKLVSATIVIDGEVGGLGESRVVYLGATDVMTGKEIRSTTLRIGGTDDGTGGPAGAAARLLEPERYKGTLKLDIDTKGATVYINGTKVTLNQKGELPVLVGTQAVRVTHPEYRDFVRFVEIPYGKTLDVPVAMTQFPMIRRDLQGKPVSTDTIIYDDPPLWRRPYVYIPVAVVLAVGAGVLAGVLAHDFPNADECRKVGGGGC